jgi:hypothetical protein
MSGKSRSAAFGVSAADLINLAILYLLQIDRIIVKNEFDLNCKSSNTKKPLPKCVQQWPLKRIKSLIRAFRRQS